MTAPLLLALKVSIVLLAALAATAALRHRSAALRHWVLAAAVTSALVVPALAAIVPAWSLATSANPAPRPAAGSALVEATFTVAHDGTTAPPQAASDPLDVARAVLVTWALGALAAGAVLLLGLVRLRGLARRATPLQEERWTQTLGALLRTFEIRRPVRLLRSADPTMVMTWGAWRPRIILPADAAGWSDKRIRVVLGHELAHIQRHDWPVLLVGHLLRALHWFNPLAWVACRRLRQESEHACDDAVLQLGVAPPEYATQLLELVRAARRRDSAPALPVARPSGLERRVHAMLNANLNRRPPTRVSRAAIASLVLLVAAAAAGLGAAQGFATVAGTLLDSQRAVLPGATVTISNAATETKTSTRTNGDGRFELVGLPPGAYVLEVALPGFRSHRAEMTLSGEHVDSDIIMRVGTLEETITVTAASDAQPPRRLTPEQIDTYRKRRDAVAARCSAASSAAPTVGRPIGGNIRPPVKLRDTRPIYPAALREAHVGGEVRLAATIATDGTVRELVPEAGHPELVQAAMDAVEQWQFDQTLLNCVPIEVEMQVRVRFRPEQ